MGLFDFFRKKEKVEEVEVRKISPSEMDLFVEKELKKEELKIGEIRKGVDEKIGNFISSLSGQIEMLKLIDLKDRKENERLKIITLENLNGYVSHLNRLVDSFKKIDNKEGMAHYFLKIESLINDFGKNSYKNHMKATILIGKELDQVQETIRIFFSEVRNVFQKNKEVIERVKYADELKVLKKNLFESEHTLGELKRTTSLLEKEREKIVEEKTKREKEISLFRESEEFKDMIKKREKVKGDMRKLEKDVDNLKKKIDLKALLKQFHEIEKKRELVRGYRESFLRSLERDENLEIIGLGSFGEEVEEEMRRMREEIVRLREEGKLNSVEKKEAFLERLAEKGDSEILKKIEEENKKLKRFNMKRDVIQEEILEKSKIILGRGYEIC